MKKTNFILILLISIILLLVVLCILSNISIKPNYNLLGKNFGEPNIDTSVNFVSDMDKIFKCMDKHDNTKIVLSDGSVLSPYDASNTTGCIMGQNNKTCQESCTDIFTKWNSGNATIDPNVKYVEYNINGITDLIKIYNPNVKIGYKDENKNIKTDYPIQACIEMCNTYKNII